MCLMKQHFVILCLWGTIILNSSMISDVLMDLVYLAWRTGLQHKINSIAWWGVNSSSWANQGCVFTRHFFGLYKRLFFVCFYLHIVSLVEIVLKKISKDLYITSLALQWLQVFSFSILSIGVLWPFPDLCIGSHWGTTKVSTVEDYWP